MGVGAYDWVFDLVHPDPDRRGAALDRHRALLTVMREGLDAYNKIWVEAGPRWPDTGPYSARLTMAERVWRVPLAETVFGALGELDTRDEEAYRLHVPFAVLFLRWEADFPDEWGEAGALTWSHWGTKEGLLRTLAGHGVPEDSQGAVLDLVAAALTREYRCKDWRYVPLARRVDGPDLRDLLTKMEGPRARFVRYVLDEPALAVTRKTWRRWLDRTGDPAVSEPCQGDVGRDL